MTNHWNTDGWNCLKTVGYYRLLDIQRDTVHPDEIQQDRVCSNEGTCPINKNYRFLNWFHPSAFQQTASLQLSQLKTWPRHAAARAAACPDLVTCPCAKEPLTLNLSFRQPLPSSRGTESEACTRPSAGTRCSSTPVSRLYRQPTGGGGGVITTSLTILYRLCRRHGVGSVWWCWRVVVLVSEMDDYWIGLFYVEKLLDG